MRCPVLLPAGITAPEVLSRVAEWYAAVSGGKVRIDHDLVRIDAHDPAWSQLASGWRWPVDADSARDAARELVVGLPERQRAKIGSDVLIIAPGDEIHPHTWRFRHGGVHLGGRRWCRRYALVATGSPLAAVAHELGHLLFGWPDLAANGIGSDCLMATGALVPPDRPPAWPCAPLRVRAGWVTPEPVRATARVGELPHGAVGEFDGLLIERRDDRLLAYTTHPPRVAIRAVSADPSRPVLAVLADVAPLSGRSAGRRVAPDAGEAAARTRADRLGHVVRQARTAAVPVGEW